MTGTDAVTRAESQQAFPTRQDEIIGGIQYVLPEKWTTSPRGNGTRCER